MEDSMKITSLTNPVVKHLVSLRKDKEYRNIQQTVIIEGKKLVEEICHETPALKIITTDPLAVKFDCKELYEVTPEIIKKISGAQNPEGILAEVPMPQEASLDRCHYILALDRVSDPGNLGTLLRTALAIGWEGVFLLDGCCDLWNDKALRSAKGATFRLPFRKGGWKELAQLIEKNKLTAIAADLEGTSLTDFKAKKGIVLVLGSESQGISKEAERLCEKVSIPMSGKMESLNVSIAGGILMYFIRNQSLK